MKKYTVLASTAESWKIEFQCEPGKFGELLKIEADGNEVLSVQSTEKGIVANIHTVWETETEKFGKKPSFDFSLLSPAIGSKICICWYGFSFRLYADDMLQDEEWPLGTPVQGTWTIWSDESVSDISMVPVEEIVQEPEQLYTLPFQNFVLPGHNTGVGDCMPFNRDGRYCLYYLFDRRRHDSKKGLGAHQWAQISTDDLKTWTIYPMAIGITEQWEGSICTGSLIRKDDKIYAFYAVRMSDGSPARLTWGVSKDGINFEKSGKYFSLTAPYEPVSARDPMVFQDEAGTYHMLVTTSLPEEGEYGGCLAHLTSDDLLAWEQQEPFIVPGYCDQPECSDYFYWNGWYYLIFSNFGTARYRMSRHPFDQWIRPETDELDSLEIRVPKTAEFQNRRLLTGFLDRLPRGYAGNAVTHELFQKEDGTLGVKHLEEILPEAVSIDCISDITLEAGTGRKTFVLPASAHGLRLKTKLKPRTKGVLAGICLHLSGQEYRIEMDPAAGTVSIIRPGESLWYGSGRDLLKNVCLSDGTEVDLLVSGDILDLSLGNGRMMTMRLDKNADAGIRAEVYAIAGTAEFEQINLFELKEM